MAIAVGIGVQKAATTWLFDALARHPEIRASRIKELDFFSARFDRGHKWYRAQFLPGNGLPFEISPSYLVDPRAPARLAAFDPNAKVILIIRDPIARAFSHHIHEITKGHIPRQSFETALAANPMYVEQGFYARYLQNWLAHFRAGAICVLDHEAITAEPKANYVAVCDFLGIDLRFTPLTLGERRNSSELARWPRARILTRKFGQLMRDNRAEWLLQQIKSTAVSRRFQRANAIDLRMQIPAPTAQTMRTLAALFHDDQAELAHIFAKYPQMRPLTIKSAAEYGIAG